jgi:hypothetical protein
MTALAAAIPAVGASGEPPPDRDRLFVGRSFAGLRLTASSPFGGNAFTFVYGDCTPPADEGGCATPLQIQNASSCRRHPLEIDLYPRRIFRARGVPVIDYGERLEVLTGRTDVVLFGAGRLVRRALDALRPTHGPARLGRPLPRPVLPRWALRELKLVLVLRARGATRRALRRRLGISVSAIRLRERLASALGSRALRVPPATTSPREMIRDRQALAIVEQLGAQQATPDQRRRAQRHRRRLESCLGARP